MAQISLGSETEKKEYLNVSLERLHRALRPRSQCHRERITRAVVLRDTDELVSPRFSNFLKVDRKGML